MEMLVIALVALVAFAAVLIPLFRRRPNDGDEREYDDAITPMAAGPATPVAPVMPDSDSTDGTDELEAEVLRYRAAVRAGTVCARCGEANPPGSAFCSDCGSRLPRADTREFE